MVALLMRLLDLISQGRTARVHADGGSELPGADRFSDAIRHCPLRYVLTDELVRCATQLAYAEGDRLSACLDLIHVPAQSLWIEWADGPRREALEAIPALDLKSGAQSRHGGALVTAMPNCRCGQVRTFWSTLNEQAHLSPIVIAFDLDRPPQAPTPKDPSVWRGETVLTMDGEPAIAELLHHLRYCFDDDWAAYYHARCHTEELRAAVLRTSLGGCAFDVPMLLAFFLLLGARDLLPRQEVRHERLNRVRRQGGKPPLLEHIEVSAPLDKPPACGWAQPSEASRQSPRLHHVRGHIVRRGAAVFWRSPHLRGNGRLGQVRSRTVVLTYGQASGQSTRAY
jgi:hypothetical protein